MLIYFQCTTASGVDRAHKCVCVCIYVTVRFENQFLIFRKCVSIIWMTIAKLWMFIMQYRFRVKFVIVLISLRHIFFFSHSLSLSHHTAWNSLLMSAMLQQWVRWHYKKKSTQQQQKWEKKTVCEERKMKRWSNLKMAKIEKLHSHGCIIIWMGGKRDNQSQINRDCHTIIMKNDMHNN